MDPGVGLEGWLRWFAHPFGGILCRGHVLLRPAFQKCQLCLWSFCVLLSIICPNTCTRLFLIPYSFLCILWFKEIFILVQALRHRVPGSSLSQQGLSSLVIPPPRRKELIVVLIFVTLPLLPSIPHPLASQVAQWVKNPPAVQEIQVMWVWLLAQEDPWRRAWQSSWVNTQEGLLFSKEGLPGEPQGQRNLVGYSP